MLAGTGLALGWVLLPFYGTILWGVIIALLFTPLNLRLRARWPRHRNLAALLTLLAVLVLVIVPFVLVCISLVAEAAALYQGLQTGEVKPALYFSQLFASLPDEVARLLRRWGLADFATLQRRLTATLAQAAQGIALQVLSVGQVTFEFVASLGITLYLAFFLIRDGEQLIRHARQVLPLCAEHQHQLGRKFITVIRATVKGNLFVAAIQGALGGLAFWALDVGGALLWAVLMALLSLLPAVGAALVWLPVALYFFVTGAVWQGLALSAWGLLVIGLVDNLLRPRLVGRDTRMPDVLVLISTLGGMAVFGLNGFVLGPTIAAMFMAVWHIAVTTHGVPAHRQEG